MIIYTLTDCALIYELNNEKRKISYDEEKNQYLIKIKYYNKKTKEYIPYNSESNYLFSLSNDNIIKILLFDNSDKKYKILKYSDYELDFEYKNINGFPSYILNNRKEIIDLPKWVKTNYEPLLKYIRLF
jgi:hypothetical protein